MDAALDIVDFSLWCRISVNCSVVVSVVFGDLRILRDWRFGFRFPLNSDCILVCSDFTVFLNQICHNYMMIIIISIFCSSVLLI